jgi:pimeloyl-ACP methyl ester carboxylesterase
MADPPEVLRSLDAYLADRRDYDPGSWDADQERAARAAVDEKHAGHVVPVVRDHAVRGAVAAMWDYRPHEALAAVAVPLLVLVAESGTADDEGARERHMALDEALRARAAAGAGEARVVRLAGAGHNLMRYRPDTVVSELRALLHRGDH